MGVIIMAVQQNKSSRSKRGMRRAHHCLSNISISIDSTSKEKHRRHYITINGFYHGRKVIFK